MVATCIPRSAPSILVSWGTGSSWWSRRRRLWLRGGGRWWRHGGASDSSYDYGMEVGGGGAVDVHRNWGRGRRRRSWSGGDFVQAVGLRRKRARVTCGPRCATLITERPRGGEGLENIKNEVVCVISYTLLTCLVFKENKGICKPGMQLMHIRLTVPVVTEPSTAVGMVTWQVLFPSLKCKSSVFFLHNKRVLSVSPVFFGLWSPYRGR